MEDANIGERQDRIKWNKFEPEFVGIETGVAKRLKLANWRQEHRFDRSGLRFDVLEEDEKAVDKTFSMTSRRLIRALRPIIQRADEQGRNDISVSILRTGEGMDTAYQVQALGEIEQTKGENA